MINIYEYLLDKGKTKKYNVDRPKKGCDAQDIIDWLDSFGVDNWYSDHSLMTTPEEGHIGYHIGSDAWQNKCASLDIPLSKYESQSIVVYPKTDRTYISGRYGSKVRNISFEQAIDFMEEIMENPFEAKLIDVSKL